MRHSNNNIKAANLISNLYKLSNFKTENWISKDFKNQI